MAIAGRGQDFGVAFLDVSTGEFLTTQINDQPPFDGIAGEVARMRPAECIVLPQLRENEELQSRLAELKLSTNEFDAAST
ncbi:MAG: DNA mismatch repair protein MutS, partial [Methanohalophilus sp. T328-1]